MSDLQTAGQQNAAVHSIINGELRSRSAARDQLKCASGLQARARSSVNRELQQRRNRRIPHIRFGFRLDYSPLLRPINACGAGKFAALNHNLPIEKFADGAARTAGEAWRSKRTPT
jgi:hypothetical protein